MRSVDCIHPMALFLAAGVYVLGVKIAAGLGVGGIWRRNCRCGVVERGKEGEACGGGEGGLVVVSADSILRAVRFFFFFV